MKGMGNVVRELREAAGLSQAELALRSGVAQPNIAAYETGRRRASASMLQRLRAAAQPLPHDALANHRHELADLASRYGLSNVRVFGSAARGTDRPGSDLDVLVTRSPGVGLLTIAAFAAAASELLGVEVDVVTDGGLRPDHEILTTAIAV
ncbi:helix-turn-helix domain-containing protein [Paenarthrobacter ureafaciens]|uniref:helix-turn-helix domain-containing protein n=1 Tax=Paenarthrobacter ureafaciens TaxID=37931 RepID=UPI0030B9088F